MLRKITNQLVNLAITLIMQQQLTIIILPLLIIIILQITHLTINNIKVRHNISPTTLRVESRIYRNSSKIYRKDIKTSSNFQMKKINTNKEVFSKLHQKVLKMRIYRKVMNSKKRISLLSRVSKITPILLLFVTLKPVYLII